MIILSNFVERFEELKFDAQLSIATLSEKLRVSKATVYRYAQGKLLPSLKVAVQLANIFNCSVDYLLGVRNANDITSFKVCPPFCEQFQFLLKHYDISIYQLARKAEMNESTLFFWKWGTHEPTLDNIEKLARFFDCSMDFILGREK